MEDLYKDRKVHKGCKGHKGIKEFRDLRGRTVRMGQMEHKGL